jgi:anti-anti-sigma factor
VVSTDPSSSASQLDQVLAERGPPRPGATLAESLGLLLDDRSVFAQAQGLLAELTGCTLRRSANALLLVAAEQQVSAGDLARGFVRAMTNHPDRRSEHLLVHLFAAALTADTADADSGPGAPTATRPEDLAIGPVSVIEPAQIGDIHGVRVCGELDLMTAGELVQAATSVQRSKSAGAAGATAFFVDLEGATFIDAAGLGALTGIRNQVRERGERLLVSTPTASAPRKLLALAVSYGWLAPEFSPPQQPAGITAA